MSEWTSARLADVADVRPSNVDKKTLPGERPVRLCNYMDVYANDYIRSGMPFMAATATEAECQRFKVEHGDVLITKDSETPDDIGITAVVVDEIEELICGYHVALLKPNRELIDSVFLTKQLSAPAAARRFSRLANGSTRYGLTFDAIASAPIHFPALSSQRRIAEILSTVDEAIEQTEALIAKTQQIKTGLMHDLFTRGVTPDGRLRPPRDQAPELYKQSPLGWIPRDWEVTDVKSDCRITSGFTLGPHRRPRNNPWPYLRVANVFAGHVDLTDVALLEVTQDEVAGRTLLPGDLLVVEGHANPGEIGRCAMVTESASGFTFQNHLYRVRPNRLDPALAMQWMNSQTMRRHWHRTCSTSSGLNTINRSSLGSAPLLLPPATEQGRISLVLDGVTGAIESYTRHLGGLTATKQGLADNLLLGNTALRGVDPALTYGTTVT